MDREVAATLICPSGAVTQEAYDAGIEALHALGIKSELSAGALERSGRFAGPHAQRSERLQGELSRAGGPLWMIRGGFGAIHTLAMAPELFAGGEARELWAFSDGTVLLAAWLRAGWPAWHAPPVVQLPRLDEASLDRVRKAYLQGEVAPFRGLDTLSAGTATGSLAGGNLTVLASMVGSPFEADLGGAIVLVEDIGEAAYRIDRLFTQLRLSGAFQGVRGFVFGEFTGIEASELADIRAFLGSEMAAMGLPAAWGLPVGHGTRNAPLPFGEALGWRARLDVGEGRASLEFERV
jgi:muramoyltetrapeptide carboxypeptidase